MSTVPHWLKKKLVVNNAFFETKDAIALFSVNTVCQSSACPNMNECFSKGKTTFMILGKSCSRACAFCSVVKGAPEAVDIEESARIADCVKRLGLEYVTVTSVTRDDLYDGGAGQFVRTVESVRRVSKAIVIELLIPDFKGRRESLEAIAASGADIIGHNIETVKRLYPVVRSLAGYLKSIGILRLIKEIGPGLVTKSAILVGLGEREDEVVEALKDLRMAGCDMLTIGQYLRPSKENHPVQRFAAPEEFARYKSIGEELGFKNVSAGPFVRSSYLAEENYKEMKRYDKCYSAAVS